MIEHRAGQYLQHKQLNVVQKIWNSIFPAMPFNDNGIFGFDISRWQDIDATPQGVDFVKMKNYGASFVIIKTGQALVADSDFVRNWRDAKAAGIPRGSYWFYDPGYSPQSQAAKWWSLVKDDPPEGRLWLDLEHPASWGGSFATWQHWKQMLDEIKRLSGLRIGIYTGYYYWQGKTVGADLNYFKQYPLWLAWYASSPAYVSVPAPWSEVLLWQLGTPAIGIEAGAESLEIDYNKFNGPEAKLLEEFGGVSIPPPPVVIPPPPTGVTMYKITMMRQGRRVSAPNANGAFIAYVGSSALWNSTQRSGDYFAHPEGGWVGMWKGTEQVFSFVEVFGDPPPPPPPPPTESPFVSATLTRADGTKVEFIPKV